MFSSVQFSPSVMSDSLQPHGLQPTRLLRPWDFPGKRTGAGAIDETVLFAAVWMHLEITRQGKTSIIRYHLHVESEIWHNWTHWQNRNRLTGDSCVWVFVTLGTAACQASLSITNSRSLLRLISIESVMPSNLILCRPPLLSFNLSHLQGLFQWVSSLHQVAKVLELQLQHQSFQWIFRTDFL